MLGVFHFVVKLTNKGFINNMPGIDELIFDKLPSLSESWAEQDAESAELLKILAKALRDNNWLLDFERISPLTDKTMVCIDGANAVEAMQVGDLIATGASVAEAHETKQYFTSEIKAPSEAYIGLLPHRNENTQLGMAVRAAQELKILKLVEGADIRIIDGTYLGQVSEVMARIAGGDKMLAKIIEEELATDGTLSAAMKELLTPQLHKQGQIIAVVKNDTSTSYAKVFKDKFNVSVGLMVDRVIADRILKPGQFLAPRWLEPHPILSIVKSRQNKGVLYENDMSISLMDELVVENLERLKNLHPLGEDNEGILWTTYFKPTAWQQEDKSIRIEFPFYRNGKDVNNTIRDFARKMVQIVDQDILNSSIMEPWCQYAVDIEAKKVSNGIRIAKSFLETHADEEQLLRMRGYRT